MSDVIRAGQMSRIPPLYLRIAPPKQYVSMRLPASRNRLPEWRFPLNFRAFGGHFSHGYVKRISAMRGGQA
jgi:hypothetical protein